MRAKKAQIAIILVSLSCISIAATALEPGTIAVPSITGANMDMPKPLITPPTMDMPDPSPKVTVVEGKRDPFADGSPFNETEGSDSDRMSGKWRVRFASRNDLSLSLTLWGSGGNKVMGFGSLNEGAADNSFSASGSVLGDNLVLSARSAAPKFEGQRYDQCDLDLILANDTLSGSYILRWQGEEREQGNATAVRA
ncbi:hypothetical protein [Methanothrix sp.]|uniref:hypothetical protein n=1 Tax=Methanothrix sp. TaxID=90426 RepID=UPI003C747F7B